VPTLSPVCRQRARYLTLSVIGILIFLVPTANASTRAYKACTHPVNMSIAYNDVVSCSATSITENDLYRFNATTGDRINIKILGPNGYYNNTCAEVLDPQGTQVWSGCGRPQYAGALTKTGQFTLHIWENGYNELMDYAFSLEREYPFSDRAVQLPYATNVNGSLRIAPDEDYYLVNGHSGDRVRIDATGPTGYYNNICMALVLHPANTTAASGCGSNTHFDVTFSATATYLLAVWENGQEEFADYSLQMTCMSGTCTNVTPTIAQMTTPAPGSVLASASITFNWSPGTGADNYWLDVGNNVGQGDISAGATSALSKVVSNLPCDGRTLYVQLWTRISNVWQTPARYTYTACNNGQALAQISSPTPGTVLPGTSATFTWNAVSGADQYWLDVGNTVTHGEIFGAATTAITQTVSGIPCDGRTIYVQLWTHVNGAWLGPQRYTYTAPATCSALIAQITSPLPGAALTFNWTSAAGATAYWLDVGTAAGQGNIFAGNVGTALSRTVTGIPTDGSTIYVQIWSQIGGQWYANRYSYSTVASR
jgi:hypothetical protein